MLLCLILLLCICVCICCVRQRTRKNKAFNPSVSEKLPSEVGSPVYRTLTPPEIHSDLDKKEVCNSMLESMFSSVMRIFFTNTGISDAS